MKTRPTSGDEVRIEVKGRRAARLFLVPRDRAEGVVRLIQDFEVPEAEKSIPWREPVRDLIEKYTEVGTALRGARTKSGLSQSELAAKLGMPQSHISDMENGRRPIGKKMAKRLSKVLKVGYKVFL